MKYFVGMGYDALLKNARLIGEYLSHHDNDWSGLHCVMSLPDTRFWVDVDGNIWEEYVPCGD